MVHPLYNTILHTIIQNSSVYGVVRCLFSGGGLVPLCAAGCVPGSCLISVLISTLTSLFGSSPSKENLIYKFQVKMNSIK